LRDAQSETESAKIVCFNASQPLGRVGVAVFSSREHEQRARERERERERTDERVRPRNCADVRASTSTAALFARKG